MKLSVELIREKNQNHTFISIHGLDTDGDRSFCRNQIELINQFKIIQVRTSERILHQCLIPLTWGFIDWILLFFPIPIINLRPEILE